MPRLSALLLLLFCATCALAQPKGNPGRGEALEALASANEAQRAEGVAWIANHGTPSDAEVLVQRLTDESPLVRVHAEQGLWLL